MAAAVADYMPERRAPGKIEKSDAPLELTLVRTPDILADARAARGGAVRPVLIGFAAESGDPVARGRAEAPRKGADLIVANDVSREDPASTPSSTPATIISRDGDEAFPLGPKTALAAMILDRAERLLSPLTT